MKTLISKYLILFAFGAILICGSCERNEMVPEMNSNDISIIVSEAEEYSTKSHKELIYSNECYNVILGGEKYTTLGTAAYMDNEGNIMQLPVNDEKVLNGDVVRVCKGYVCVRDMDGNTFRVSINDERYLNG